MCLEVRPHSVDGNLWYVVVRVDSSLESLENNSMTHANTKRPERRYDRTVNDDERNDSDVQECSGFSDENRGRAFGVHVSSVSI